MAVMGVIKIETRMTEGDECGIYRITSGKQGYLMLAFDDADEARTVAKEIAKLLKVSYHDHIWTEPSPIRQDFGHVPGVTTVSDISKPPAVMIDVSRPEGAVRPKPKKVMGAGKLCRELLEAGQSETQVEEALSNKYLAAGHQATRARELARDTLRVVQDQTRNGR